MSDPSFQDATTPESDPATPVDRPGRGVQPREAGKLSAELARHTLRLDCSGELVCIESVSPAVSRAGGVLMEFVCPLCDELHLSRLFR